MIIFVSGGALPYISKKIYRGLGTEFVTRAALKLAREYYGDK